MVPHRLLLIAAAIMVVGAAACAPMPVPAVPNKDIKAIDFEAAISRLEKDDPQSPEALNTRLEYADFLSEPAGDDCQQRLTAAQSQVDTVTGRPAINVLPLGPARIANVEYKIHLARTTCGGDQPPLKSELQQALESAQHAVDLYRNALDYQSAAIMQFNVAATYHELGDVDDAVSALESTIAMDREYGFRQDAEDNNRLLLSWKGGAASDSDVAALMTDFPARSAEFRFHWSSTDADVAVSVDDINMFDGKVIRSRGSVGLKHHVRADPMGWTVSNDPGNGIYDLGEWPADARKLQWSTMYFIASALLQAPSIKIGRDGDFNSVADPQAFGATLAVEVSAKIGEIPSDNDSETADATMRDLKAAFSPNYVESSAMQNYGIETGTWIGAKLGQGVWYQMSTPLFLPALGLGHYLVNHDISFAFTRQVPCTTESSALLCAEIVIHATPNANDLKSTLEEVNQQLRLPNKQSLHYLSVTDIRLVIDPDTLLPHVCDTRQYWYALKGGGSADPIIESVRTVSTSVYH
jgi:tetratricopeptide (TPR) repeat protein